jgi:UDP-N-acetylmuramoyl-L-alanyl-D-glutamate--2,6-diaminopimelate ligase
MDVGLLAKEFADHGILRQIIGSIDGLAIESISADSRTVRSGALFICIRGFEFDGHLFAHRAVSAGAVVLVAEEEVPGLNAPCLLVSNSRIAAGLAASVFNGHPCRSIKLVGITGTNGKTTITYVVRSILEAHGIPTGIIGTNAYLWADQSRPATTTTPGQLEIHQLLASMRQAGCQAAAMEVSSHALDQGRTWALEFDAAVFTNLSRDHLDYHSGMEDYFRAKRRLFEALPSQRFKKGISLVNADDPYGRRLLAWMREEGMPALAYGLADQCPVSMEMKPPPEYRLSGTRAVFRVGNRALYLHLRLIGRHNVYNLLAALGVSQSLGLELDQARLQAALDGLAWVKGRLQPINAGQPFHVLVDYAHTPEALRAVLAALVPLQGRGRVITVFGAGGDRDRGKRPLMGEAAASLSQVVVVTSDNPRTEDPEAIIRMILSGIPNPCPAGLHVEPDRRKAISLAVQMARPDDIVLIAGKGHEDYQIVGKKKLHFDDVEEAEKSILLRMKGRNCN